jgi:hypothetical protein
LGASAAVLGEHYNRAVDRPPSRQLNLAALAGDYAICRLAANAGVPDWAAGEFVSVTRTADELSVVCATDAVPPTVRCEPGWSCFKLLGPFAFDEIGVLAAIAAPLAAAAIGIFVISTFDTDYLLVKTNDRARTIATLVAAGHAVASGGEEGTTP